MEGMRVHVLARKMSHTVHCNTVPFASLHIGPMRREQPDMMWPVLCYDQNFEKFMAEAVS